MPIFWATGGDHALCYVPRLLCVLDRGDAPAVLRHVTRLASGRSAGDLPLKGFGAVLLEAAARLVQAARDAARDAADASRQEFEPECLTLYVNGGCNMRCRYCYSKPVARGGGRVSVEGARAAARLVAESCAARKTPFTLALHGGGEPTLDLRHADCVLGAVREETRRAGVRLCTYVATNGAVPEETARWLATQFDLVGVSCDGPPEIQDRNRPGRDGRQLSGQVGRTMAVLRRLGRPFHVRTTITRETVGRQEQIVSYLARHHAPGEIRLEPVYANPSGEEPLDVAHAAAFVDGFLAAQAAGGSRGIPVTTSITRPAEIYGSYCNVLRRVVNLVPGDVATACFLEARPDRIARRGLQTGTLDPARGQFLLDAVSVSALIARCSARPAACDDCLCAYQCTYGCPDRCLLGAAVPSPTLDGERANFRCLVNRMLMERVLLDTAERAWARIAAGQGGDVRGAQQTLRTLVCRGGRLHEVAQ